MEVGLNEKIYAEQDGHCSECGGWNPLHWLGVVEAKTGPKLVCLGCSIGSCRSEFWTGGKFKRGVTDA